MRIVVTKQGGLFDLNRAVEVDDGSFAVKEDGEIVTEGSLSHDALSHLQALAHRILELQPPDPPHEHAVDSGTTTVFVDENAASWRHTSGEGSPGEIWDLLDEIERIAST